MNAAAETALVLSGGGAYGAFSVGVMKVLFAGRSPATGYQPLQADIFTGASVGSFNAALMVAYPGDRTLDTALRLESIWLDRVAKRPGSCGNHVFRVRNPLAFLDVNCSVRQPAVVASNFAGDTLAIGSYVLERTANFLASSGSLENRLIDSLNIGSFIDEEPFHRLVQEVIPEAAIRQSPLRLSVSTTDWVNGKVRYFSNPDFHHDRGVRSVVASAAVPGFFPPIMIDGSQFVDGGVVDNTPIGRAINLGATELHAIYMVPQPKFIPLSAMPNTLETLLRVYYLMLAAKISEDIESVRWINNGLRLLQRPAGHISEIESRDLARAAGQILGRSGVPYRPIVVHRYIPGSILGGTVGSLDFGLDEILEMIRQGEAAALLHDCAKSCCVLVEPEGEIDR